MVELGGATKEEPAGHQVRLSDSQLVFPARTIGLLIWLHRQLPAALEAGFLDLPAVALVIYCACLSRALPPWTCFSRAFQKAKQHVRKFL